MLTANNAFKVAFLSRCVQDGLTPVQILQRVKTALDLFEKQAILGKLIDAAGNAVGGTAKTLASYSIPLALAAPPIIGGTIGYGLSKMTDADETDVDDIKNRELVEEYQRQAARLRRQKSVREYAKTLSRPGRPYM